MSGLQVKNSSCPIALVIDPIPRNAHKAKKTRFIRIVLIGFGLFAVSTVLILAYNQSHRDFNSASALIGLTRQINETSKISKDGITEVENLPFFDVSGIKNDPLHNPKTTHVLKFKGDEKYQSSHKGFNSAAGYQKTGPANGHLTYYNGPLLRNVKVFVIFWGKNINFYNNILQLYPALVNSEHIDILNQYGIGHGSVQGFNFGDSTTTSGTVTEAQVLGALKYWISIGWYVPDPNTYFAFHFGAGITVVNGNGQTGQQANYCAYHGYTANTFNPSVAPNLYYGMMPDIYTGSCGNEVNAAQGLAAHELFEAITDPIPGQGWYDRTNNMEISDMCAWQFGQFLYNSGSYVVQKEFSNAVSNCVTTNYPIILWAGGYMSPSHNPYRVSPNGYFALATQPNGVTIIYNRVSSNIAFSISIKPISYGCTYKTLDLQTGGNLVQNDNCGNSLWISGATGTNFRMVMQDDGNLVV